VVSIAPAGNSWAVRCDALAAVLNGDGPEFGTKAAQ